VRAEDKALLDLLTGAVRRADGSALARWYVPNDTLVAWIADEATHALLSEHDRVDWVGRYEPAYKLDARIGRPRKGVPARARRVVVGCLCGSGSLIRNVGGAVRGINFVAIG
jgi:hypothetical protein